MEYGTVGQMVRENKQLRSTQVDQKDTIHSFFNALEHIFT